MTQQFRDKNVMIVGATGGLGSAFARAFAAEGGRLLLVGRDKVALQRIAAEFGDGAVAYPLDLASLDGLADFRATLATVSGRLHVVVNAAGVDVRRSLDAHSVTDIQRLLDVNLRGAIMLTQALLPVLHEDGQIVHVGAFADGRLAFPYHTVDVATRAGLFTFIEGINRELALSRRRVLVSYFAPGPTDTETEREFHPLWRELSIRIDPIDQVVRELFETIQRRQPVHLMGGFSTRLFAHLNAVWPQLADWLVMRRYGRILKGFLSAERNTVLGKTYHSE
ncbi:putative oxidoreductase [Thermoflexales bacterium]|nr:putative oxidoreductase [Thermoflexales bacterium]